ncbi:type II toxin-antitoxin system VapC family toxin [soil metagenome]
MLVLDSSVTLAWALPDEESAYADALVAEVFAAGVAAVPSLWFSEVSNVLATNYRCGRLTDDQLIEAIGAVKSLPVEIDGESPQKSFDAVLALAKRHKITTYDATYLDIAIRRKFPLGTLDSKLRVAAKAEHVEIP